MRALHPYLTVGRPMVLAHRGDSLHAPANTMPAFTLAVDAGADALETDVHWTKDGVIVVCHDETVDATSNGRGAIKDLTYEELKQLDFGYRFSMDGGLTFPYRNCGVTVPTLRELLAAFPNMRVNVDIKAARPVSLRQFIDEVYACGAETRVLAASFHDSVLRQLRSMNNVMATSASTLETALFCLRVWTHLAPPVKMPYCALQVPLRHYGLQVVSDAFVRHAHAANTHVHVWTIDDEETMKSLLQMGVDGIVTNNPGLAIQVRDAHVQSASA